METPAKTTPKDFFLWLGALIALYGSVTSFLTLLFEYINNAYPDPLAYYGDPYGGAVRTSMAMLMVLVPATIILFRLIRGSIDKEPSKASIWVRRWALVLTLFIAGVAVVIDLITIINTFLGGEISTRFFLKAAVVLLVAVGVFLHFLADVKGYWIVNVKKANLIGIGVGILALISIVSGFFIIGTPGDVRALRFDAQKVSDLQNIQYQIVYYWQTKQALPSELAELADPLSGSVVPVDPETGAPYRYERTSDASFKLCGMFTKATPDTAGKGQYPGRDIAVTSWGPQADENWTHGEGEHCYERTIDPERYPPFSKGNI
jgi:hypothetical protein